VLSTWAGRAASLVTQYFSFFVQLGVAAVGASTTSDLWETLRDMEMTRSALGRRPWEGPRLCRDWDVWEGAREALWPCRGNDVESIATADGAEERDERM